MRTLTLFVFLFISRSNIALCQSNHSVNLIISIDDSVISKPIDCKLVLYRVSMSDTLDANYIPGRLVLERKYNTEQLAKEVTKIKIIFSYELNYKSILRKYEYEIPLSNDALIYSHNIVEIFNLDNDANKNRFVHSESEKYVFDYSCQNFGRLIQRK